MNTAFYEQIEAALMARQGSRKAAEITFLCVTHDDHRPSAAWNTNKHVWHCFVCGAGGGAVDVATRLGIEAPSDPASGLTLHELSEHVGLPSDFLRSIGLSEGVAGVGRTKCVDIPYLNESGDVAAIRKRLRLSGEPRMIWRRNDKALPYGLRRLDRARGAGAVLLVEGESDSWTCWYAGVPALGLPGASTWREEWRRYMQDIAVVYVWREPDKGGDTLIADVSADLPEVRIIEPPPGLKDLNELWHSVGHGKEAFLSRLAKLMAAARPASQLRAEALGTEARDLLQRCRSLLEDPRLLDKVKAAITANGYAGDTTAPLLAYLGITSRLLERPLNLAYVAQSGAGKNAAVDAALVLVPEDAYFLEKAGSARALIYADVSFEHRSVIVSEADSIPQDEGSAASAIRSLAEDGYMTYDVVVQDGDGNFVTRRITKTGPTGLITTSTKPLKEQMSTRMFTVPISDSPDQTREVMRAHAVRVNGAGHQADASAFIDMQRWLALAGDHVVTVPYSHALAELVPSTHVRMRRDFRQLLTIIQSVALLHQRQRDRDEAGRVVATLDDYRMARELVLSVFTAAASGGITPIVRQTVEGLQKIHGETKTPVTRKALGDSLGLATDTVWHRVQRAIDLGYIVNQETRERQPAKLVPGDPLPEDRPALPDAAELSEYMCVAQRETASIVQSEGLGQTQGEPEAAFEDGIESSVHTDIQSPPEDDLDSETPPPSEPIERLSVKSGVVHTRPEGDRRLFDGDDESDLIYCPGFDAQGCDEVVSTSEGYCVRHLRGLALVALDHAHWPRLNVSDGNVTEGADNWRRWLREAGPGQMREVLAALADRKLWRR